MVDAYEVLQVHPRAEHDVIQAAFRTLARKYHPDFGGTGARMVALNDAWAILGDPKRRKAYDTTRLVEAAANGTVASAGTADRAARGTTTHSSSARAAAAQRAAHEAAFGATENREYETASPAAPPPPGGQTGTILDFGRYEGWSLIDLARQDPYYLEWLERTPIGRPMRSEIQDLLGAQRATAAASATAVKSRPRRKLWSR